MKRTLSAVICFLFALAACAGDADEPAADSEAAQTIASFDGKPLAFDTRDEAATWSSKAWLENAFWASALSQLVYLSHEQLAAELAKLGFDQDAPGNALATWSDARTSTTVAYVGTPRWGALVFRGTQQRRDWLTNVDWLRKDAVGPGLASAHNGFERALSSVWPDVRAMLVSRGHAASARKPLFVMGHSLGGALAVLATHRALFDGCWDLPVKGDVPGRTTPWQQSTLSLEDLTKVPDPRQAASPGNAPLDWGVAGDGTPKLSHSCLADALPVAALFTFGQPKVGDRQFANLFGARAEARGTPVFRFRNGADIVSTLPEPSGYVHVDRLAQSETNALYQLSSAGTLTLDADAEAARPLAGCRFQRVSDHAVRFYVGKLRENAAARLTGRPVEWPTPPCAEEDPHEL